jgi:glycosyltransferase involved in cell wall biosynthesis
MQGGVRYKGIIKQSRPNEPLISIITVVFNGEKFLGQTIESVLSQTYKNYEYIIIDGGSTDRSIDIIKKYENNIDYWISEPDKGIYDAMNKGIGLARGEFIAFLNADDYYEPGAVEAVVRKFEADPAAQVLYGNTFFLNEAFNLRYKSYASLRYWRGMCFSHQAMFVHRDIYRLLGTYDAGLRIAADYDFVVRAATKGVRFTPVDAFLVNYRDSGLSARNQIASMREGRRVLRRYAPFFSSEHLTYAGLLVKSMLLIALLKMLKAVCGEKALARASSWYLKTFIAREWEPLR